MEMAPLAMISSCRSSSTIDASIPGLERFGATQRTLPLAMPSLVSAIGIHARSATKRVVHWVLFTLHSFSRCLLHLTAFLIANCLDESLAKPLSPDSLSAATNETDGFCAIPYERFNQLVSPPFPGLCIKPLFLLTTDVHLLLLSFMIISFSDVFLS